MLNFKCKKKKRESVQKRKEQQLKFSIKKYKKLQKEIINNKVIEIKPKEKEGEQLKQKIYNHGNYIHKKIST